MYSDEDTQHAPVRTVQEGRILVRQGRRFEFTVTHVEMVFPSGPLFVVEVNCFPESDPDIEHSQAAAKAANKAVGNERPQSGRCEQEVVVRPFRTPGQDHQKHTHGGAEKNEQQYQDAVQPELKPCAADPGSLRPVHSGVSRNFASGTRMEPCRGRIWSCGHIALPWVVHATGRCSSARAPKSRRKPIVPFYDFRALMRSATSR